MSKNNISFILHKPQLSENIGLCARGIKNFGFKSLLLIEKDFQLCEILKKKIQYKKTRGLKYVFKC